MALSGLEHRRMLDRLTREISRLEGEIVELPSRERKRLGDAPPVSVLRDIAAHAKAMRPRFERMVCAHDLVLHRAGFGALSALRHLMIDHVLDPEQAYRSALLELRRIVELVVQLREVSRRDEVFGLVRWCDDWLAARRTLVARAEAQLAWFAEQEAEAARVASLRRTLPREPANLVDDDDEDFALRVPPSDPEPRPGSPGARDHS